MSLTGTVLATESDPFTLFRTWFDAVVAEEVVEPDAMVLATADGAGHPSARAVLLKGFDERGFRFFTNYGSAKAGDLRVNPNCALTFVWPALVRQVRVRGRAERISRTESAAYFATRARGSQLGAWASHQSEVIADREVLDRRLAELEARFPVGEEVPLPPFWGGYVVVPDSIEFWEGRRNRLHDRLRYSRTEPAGEWKVERLSP
ncbi:MAG TPA: pyridoxamine 5'-phosphate oxidase [Acidimicrobiales bacterium]|nr:pyridoxamine 5'-phosphate oxidase [Acidimicrobiales bacterium]